MRILFVENTEGIFFVYEIDKEEKIEIKIYFYTFAPN